VPHDKPYQLPALDPATVLEERGNGYPEPFESRMREPSRRQLGDACRLEKLGVNLATLAPGAQSALRHWHTLEDEFVYVLSGEVTLISDVGEQLLTPGMCAGYPAGNRDGHHFINQSDQPVVFLEIGSRIAGDSCFYPDDDMMWIDLEDGWRAAHKDGTAY